MFVVVVVVVVVVFICVFLFLGKPVVRPWPHPQGQDSSGAGGGTVSHRVCESSSMESLFNCMESGDGGEESFGFFKRAIGCYDYAPWRELWSGSLVNEIHCCQHFMMVILISHLHNYFNCATQNHEL